MAKIHRIPAVIVGLVLAATPAFAGNRTAGVGDEVRTPRELARRVADLEPFGTVLAAVVVDTGREPAVRQGTYSPTRSVSVREATVLRTVDGKLTYEPQTAATTIVLYPSSLWSAGTKASARPDVAQHVLLVAQRVGNVWVAFPEVPGYRLAPDLLTAPLAGTAGS